jgi:hypothetical protein
VGGASRLPRAPNNLLSSSTSSESLLSCDGRDLGSGTALCGVSTTDVGGAGAGVTVDIAVSSTSFEEAARCASEAGLGGGAIISWAAPADTRRDSRIHVHCGTARGSVRAASPASAHGFAPVFGTYDAGTRTLMGLCSPALLASSAAKATRPGLRHSSPLSARSMSLYRLVTPPVRCAGVHSSWNCEQSHVTDEKGGDRHGARSRMRRHHECKVACVAMRADDSWKLMHAADTHASSYRRMDVVNEFGRVSTARPCALVEQNEHWPPERQAHVRGCTGAAKG